MTQKNVVLADRPGLGRVKLCECNSVHLSLGPVTITLAPEAFAQAAILIRNAMDQFVEIMEANHDTPKTLEGFQPGSHQLMN